MAIFRCKMCGGDIEVNEGNSAAVCEFCGTEQTIPTVKDENLQSLFNRANVLRMKSEFDKAEEIYEKILQTNESEAEAYWGLILCKYGIEYVEDPATFKRIPTCHRTSYDAITADEDYKSAIKYADVVQKSIYEAEAKAIDEIQKGILSISQQKSPYDVFICYKETDESGKRTVDSTIANDIYYQLTQEGFKVFYAAITLEDKLGTEYEPYIFSALNTAKVMLALGTKPEYFNAVWVKNEWSRFLKIMKKDRSKLLIPCYRDMDAYELPEEFAHLQAQDMSKIGFINDVVRGIKKVIVKKTQTAAPAQNVTVVSGASANVENLIKRGNLALEDKKWEEATSFFEQVLNENVEEPRAHFGKLLAERKFSNENELKQSTFNIKDSDNYKKAYRFGDDDFKRMLENYTIQITYNNANRMYGKNDIPSIEKAIEIFTSIIDFKNSREKIDKCKEKIYDIALEHMTVAKTEQEFLAIKSEFERISGYSDADVKAAECAAKASDSAKEIIYQEALKLGCSDVINDIKTAISKLNSIIEYKDSKETIEIFNNKIQEIIKQEEGKKRQAEMHRQAMIKEEIKKKKRNKIIAVISSASIIAIIAFVLVLKSVIIPNVNYNKAMEFYENGDYYNAVVAFAKMNEYKDSKNMLKRSQYARAMALYDSCDYDEAIEAFRMTPGYEDSETMIQESYYMKAMKFYESGDYNNAITAFREMNGY